MATAPKAVKVSRTHDQTAVMLVIMHLLSGGDHNLPTTACLSGDVVVLMRLCARGCAQLVVPIWLCLHKPSQRGDYGDSIDHAHEITKCIITG